MAMKHTLYLICFDIVKNKTRYRCAKHLLNYGRRVQKSVFECSLNDAQFMELKNKLDNTIDPETDSMRYYILCKNCAENILISGIGNFTDYEELIII